MTQRRRRTPKIKAGQLMAYYGYADGVGPDLCVNWGPGTGGSPDGRILCSALSSPVSRLDGNKPFFEELEARGYDLNTLRFTIQRKRVLGETVKEK